jgi:hypothetical protein
MATFGQGMALQPAKSQLEAAPTPAAAMGVYRAVERWVREWRVPGELPAELVAEPGLGGVHVQLRLDGELIGRGQGFPAPGAAGGEAVLTAMREALAAAEGRLQLPNDAMRDDALRVQAARIMISLEFAGPLIAIEPRTWGEAELTLSPGLEGVAVAIRGEGGRAGKLAAAFPSLLIATNTLPHRALSGLCAQVIGEGGAAAALDEPQQIRARHGIAMYRFRSTHLAQCRLGAEPIFLYRGARLIDQSEITAAELRRMAGAMAAHLASKVEHEPEGAPLNPVSGVAGTRSSETVALAMLAIGQYGALGPQILSPQDLKHATAAWRGLGERLTALDSGEELSETAVFLLVPVVRAAAALPLPLRKPDCFIDAYQEPVKHLMFREWPDGDLFAGVPSSVRAVCAFAYATWPSAWRIDAEEHRKVRTPIEVEAAIRGWVGKIPQAEFVAHMPWLGWAEIELARRRAGAGGKHVDIPSAVALREMREQVWEHQIGAMDVDEDSMDMAGGIVFTKGTSPLPTWQCTRPLAFIATMLADNRLTEPKERAIELARLLQSLRFVRQLQADESIGWMAANPEKAIGGVRAAPWDQSMPPDATSMALLTVVEALRSLEVLANPAVVAPAGAQPAVDVPAANP